MALHKVPVLPHGQVASPPTTMLTSAPNEAGNPPGTGPQKARPRPDRRACERPGRTIKRVITTLAGVSLLAIVAVGCMATAPAPSAPPSGCAAALAYLAAHAAPGFVSSCPHDAGGNAAETVVPPQPINNRGVINGAIYINDTSCAAAYENEAANSHGHFALDANGDDYYTWVWPVPLDPYGRCP